jgi:hypothetical protein
MATTVHLADLFGKGLPPVAGGALDQSVWFLEAERALRIDELTIRNESHG